MEKERSLTCLKRTQISQRLLDGGHLVGIRCSGRAGRIPFAWPLRALERAPRFPRLVDTGIWGWRFGVRSPAEDLGWILLSFVALIGGVAGYVIFTLILQR